MRKRIFEIILDAVRLVTFQPQPVGDGGRHIFRPDTNPPPVPDRQTP
jgi:hypothetical protein